MVTPYNVDCRSKSPIQLTSKIMITVRLIFDKHNYQECCEMLPILLLLVTLHTSMKQDLLSITTAFLSLFRHY
jgi:hypothetical protein